MGKRTLAYPISKQTKGLYTCLDYAANGPAVSEIERNLRLDENVLRYLTVVKAEEIDVEARAAEVVARGEDVSTTPEQTIDEINVRDETSEASVADEISDNVPVAAKEEV
jgi:small subunit ribosomal protein S6